MIRWQIKDGRFFLDIESMMVFENEKTFQEVLENLMTLEKNFTRKGEPMPLLEEDEQ